MQAAPFDLNSPQNTNLYRGSRMQKSLLSRNDLLAHPFPIGNKRFLYIVSLLKRLIGKSLPPKNAFINNINSLAVVIAPPLPRLEIMNCGLCIKVFLYYYKPAARNHWNFVVNKCLAIPRAQKYKAGTLPRGIIGLQLLQSH